jgi:hypothetical protein
MTEKELFEKVQAYNDKLKEYGSRKQLHTSLGTTFPEEKQFREEIDKLLKEIAMEFVRQREIARAEGA